MILNITRKKNANNSHRVTEMKIYRFLIRKCESQKTVEWNIEKYKKGSGGSIPTVIFRKISFNNESKMKIFSDKRKIIGCVVTK